MKILIQVTDKEILNQLEKENIKDYALEHNLLVPDYTEEELFNMLKDKVENDGGDVEEFMTKKLSIDYLIDYFKEDLNYFVSDDISELLRQINLAGCIHEVIDEFRLEYEG